VDNTLLLVVWAIAAAVAMGATVAALRAGRRARKAADLVAQLLEPAVVVDDAQMPAPEVVEHVDPASLAAASPFAPSTPFAEPAASTDTPAAADTAPVTPAATDTAAVDTEAVDTAPDPDAGIDLAAAEMVTAPEPPRDAPPPARPERQAAPSSGDGRRDPGQARIPVFDLDRLRWWLTDGEVTLGRIAVVSVELDNLAYVNERLGYKAGAHLIEAITTRLRAVTRPRDVVALVNPERFVLVCRDVPDRAAAQALAERIAMGVAHPSVVVAGVAEVTASIGVALAFAAHERPENVLRRAIKAGKRARDLGGARIEISEDAPSPTIADDEFTTALAHDELVLHYLPIVSCATGRVAGLEALVRWDHPARGLLLPSEFLPDAERTGAIVAIGTWALEQACRQMAEWHEASGEALKLDLNVSAREFAEPTFPAQVKRVIGGTGLDPGAVWLEVTEDTLSQNRDAADRALHQLHEVGVRLVIDDFGTGASSLVSLKEFPFDAIKIERAFIADLGRNRESDAICSAIVDLAHSLGLCAIAEGVETLEQLAALKALGCELGQGHLFGPARPAADYGTSPSSTLGVEQA
jgi:diguanylate cyclase (GGDEF)-like protein